MVPQRKGVPVGEAKAKPEGGQSLEGNKNADGWVLMPAALEQVHVARWFQRPSQAKARGIPAQPPARKEPRGLARSSKRRALKTGGRTQGPV